MKINLDGIKLLEEIIAEDRLNYDKLVDFTKTKAMKAFMEHEESFHRQINKSILIEELIKSIKDEYYMDKYGFYILKENRDVFRKSLKDIEKNQTMILERALSNVYKFVPNTMKIRPNIYIYAGGIDGGFTIYRKNIFINYIKYFNSLEDFIEVISHELFHCRDISLGNKFKNLYIDSTYDKNIYKVLGKVLEEGIACLIQHGNILKKDDPVGTLTKEKMDGIYERFQDLNNILLDIKENSLSSLRINTLDTYPIGYHIAKTLYDLLGKEALLPWIERYDYSILIKSYIEAMRQMEGGSGFTNEIENWLLHL